MPACSASALRLASRICLAASRFVNSMLALSSSVPARSIARFPAADEGVSPSSPSSCALAAPMAGPLPLLCASRRRASSSSLSCRARTSGDLSRADVFPADLSRADLSRADPFRADRSGTDPSLANCFGANTSGSDSSRSDFSSARRPGRLATGVAGRLWAGVDRRTILRAEGDERVKNDSGVVSASTYTRPSRMIRLPGAPVSGVPSGACRHRRPSISTMPGSAAATVLPAAPALSSIAAPRTGSAAGAVAPSGVVEMFSATASAEASSDER